MLISVLWLLGVRKNLLYYCLIPSNLPKEQYRPKTTSHIYFVIPVATCMDKSSASLSHHSST